MSKKPLNKVQRDKLKKLQNRLYGLSAYGRAAQVEISWWRANVRDVVGSRARFHKTREASDTDFSQAELKKMQKDLTRASDVIAEIRSEILEIGNNLPKYLEEIYSD